ncbi:MAG: hypothetical protein NZ929_07375 [Aigarchaeota archaeon]|nr:hypothetical protein [Aigarchaeota archaeon]MDW7986934.1 hypothetical protein [Nitrososphaerota archaeon]
MSKKIREELEKAKTFGEIFELVKKTVKRTLGLHRAGLELVLMSLPNNVGALHEIGSNVIIMNEALLEAMLQVSRSRTEVNSYVFVILLHEYLHSLGYIDEEEVRLLVKRIIAEVLGEDHISYHLASTSIYEVYPELQMLGPGKIGKDTKIVKDFDRESTHYIG